MPELALLVFYAGLSLCFWRRPGDRWHVLLCLVGVALWSGTLVLLPATRLPMLGIATITFVSLARPFHRIAELRQRITRREARVHPSTARIADHPVA